MADKPKTMFQELREHLEPDKHNLDEEWIHQPDLFYRVSRGLADANAAVEQIKLELSQATAELDAQLRNESASAEKRVTETAIMREIEQSPKIADMKAKLAEAVRNVGRWAALKEAYQQRSWALKDLTALHLANYYQTNSGGHQRREAAADSIRAQAGQERRNRDK